MRKLTILLVIFTCLTVYAQTRKTLTKKTTKSTTVNNNSGESLFSKAEKMWNFNYELSNHYYWAAAKAGYKECYNKAGNRFYSIGNYSEAEKWYDKAVAAGNKWGYINKARLYRDGKGHSKDFNEYINICIEETEALHDTYGYRQIGISHLKGIGVPKNENIAEKWFAEYGIEGYKDMAYEYLEIGKSDASQAAEASQAAIKLYLKITNIGDYRGFELIGDMFKDGKGGIVKDYKQAISHYTKALEKFPNDANIMYKIGYCYERQEDLPNSFIWYKKSAELNHAHSCYCMGWAYNYGRGVVKNTTEALRWYDRASDLGSHSGMEKAAEFYYNGIGCTKNIQKAKTYAVKAFENGQELSNEGPIVAVPASSLAGLTLYKLNTVDRVITMKLNANGTMIMDYWIYSDDNPDVRVITYATMLGTYTKKGTTFSWKLDKSSYKMVYANTMNTNLGTSKNQITLKKLKDLEINENKNSQMPQRFKYDLSILDNCCGTITLLSKDKLVLDNELEFTVYDSYPSGADIVEAMRMKEKDVCNGIYD